LVEGQTQGGGPEDDLFAIPPLEEEDVLLMCFMKHMELMKIP